MNAELLQILEKITSAQPDNVEPFDAAEMKVGDVIRQGDIYLHRVKADHPRGKLLATRKLAIGQGEGSNHMAEGAVEVYEGTQMPSGVTEPDWVPKGSLLGPLVVGLGEWTNTHTTHRHNKFPKGTCIQVTYQADYATRERVVD